MSEWISVKNALPPDSVRVLVSYQSSFNEFSGMLVAACIGGCFYAGSNYSLKGITHWMPLPGPPEVE